MTADQPEQVDPNETIEESEVNAASDATTESEVHEPEVTEPTPPTAEEQLAERTSDLQRLQAEYINYKRRVDRDRVLVKAQGEVAVLRSLLTVLDDIGRAAEHGQLDGGFKAVADALQSAVKGHKLEAFGAKGDVFDPRLHEALFHAGESPEVTETTVDSVLRAGYRVGEDVIRHAQVSVIDPAGDEAPVVEEQSETAPVEQNTDETE